MWKDKLVKNSLGLRLLIGFLVLVVLTLFLNFREIKVDMLPINSIATHFVVAQTDFEFPDEVTTIVLRQEALSNVRNIYKIDDKDIKAARLGFEKFLSNNNRWRKKYPTTTYEEIYETLDAIENILLDLRFTDARTMQRLKEFDQLSSYLIISLPADNEEIVTLPPGYWTYLKDFSFDKRLKEQLGSVVDDETIKIVVEFFEKRKWTLNADFAAQNKFRKMVEETIPQKFTRIKAGSVIINQGEKVNANHIAMLQAMKQSMNKMHCSLEPLTILGNFLIAFLFFILTFFYMQIDYKHLLQSWRKLALIASILVLTLIYAKTTEYLLLYNSVRFFEELKFPLILPFTAILLSILIDYRIAVYISSLLAVMMSLVLAVDPSRFLIMNLVAILTVVVSAKKLHKRKDVFTVCFKCFLAVIPIIFAYNFIGNSLWNSTILSDLLNASLFLVVTAILVVGFLPLFEYLFDIMTDITLMEYMDPNNELLKRLALEIPGTYQHSLVLGNLSEIAATSISANGLFCKVATLYHDIGKLNNAPYFTENQQAQVNIHQLLTPLESAQVIISHVRDGEMIARKYHLPQAFIDIIKEHHGTTPVYYFYRKEKEMKGEVVDEKSFRYPGPKPHTKEAAIIMITDTIEAASRSLETISEEKFVELVDKLVKERADDGQFDECPLTFQELGILKKTIVKTLISTKHVRVKYPELHSTSY